MKRKTPAALGGRGVERLGSISNAPFILGAYRAQLVANRYATCIEAAAIVAALAFQGGTHA
ncbi:hypothetical protein EOE18_13185 [Novosphingobium umbonatum]|uniref:Uncharacterized protein n=1 Tax=Novosphingobium umbonatum TaxID=1908524 RepID=A0A3S2V5K0_9SPHN|nr:hypothetical protein [Novosphingobium umbonatum]RVU04119.1 hypothetical protein EOE18_13185 [Novosphingobium umbonatum]